MYFVVYLIESGEHVVVPSHWIYDTTGVIWNKFVNTGLNSSQKYICYWRGNGSTEYFGAPSLGVAANFNADFVPNFPLDEGLYYCRIRYFNVQYLEALQYCLRRRNNVPPAVVNPRRMTQLPLPVVVVPVRVENPVIIADGEDGNEYEAIPADDENEPAPAIIVDAEVENANEEPIPENVVAEVENQREELIPENDEGAGSATQHATAAETAQIIVKAEVAIPVQSLAQLEIFCAAADPDCSSGIAVENIAIEPAAGTSSIGFAQPSVLETVDVDEIARVDDLRDIETDDSDSAIEPSTTESAATGENENHQCNESGENGAGIVADNIAIEPTTGTSTLNLAQLSILETVKGDTNGRDLNCDTVDDLSGNETDDPSTAAIEPSITDSAAIGENNNHQFNEHGENGVMVTAPTNNVVCIVNSDDEEEIVISYSGDTFPVPMQSMDVPEDFVKQENDRISGSKCFKEDGVGRRYIVGDGVVLIPKTTVNTFLLWSTFPLRDQKEKDKFMVQMLLLCCLSATDLEQRSVPQAKMIFIEVLLRIRVQSSNDRMKKIPRYVAEFFEKRGKQ